MIRMEDMDKWLKCLIFLLIVIFFSSCAGFTKKVDKGEKESEEKEVVGLQGGIDEFWDKNISKGDKVIDLSSDRRLRRKWMGHRIALVPTRPFEPGEEGFLELASALKDKGLDLVEWVDIIPVLKETEQVKNAEPEAYVTGRLWYLYNCQLTLFVKITREKEKFEVVFDEKSIDGSVFKQRSFTVGAFESTEIASRIIEYLKDDLDVVTAWTGKVISIEKDRALISGGAVIGMEEGRIITVYRGITPIMAQEKGVTGYIPGKKIGKATVERVRGDKLSYILPADGVTLSPGDVVKFQ